jgi:hypothetical protein
MKWTTLFFFCASQFFISCDQTNNKGVSTINLTEQKSDTFSYKILQTTGNDKQILYNGHFLDIYFLESSNQEAVNSLLSLKWGIFSLNTPDKLQIIGNLVNDSILVDIQNDTCYGFALKNWSISVPFDYLIEPLGWGPGDPHITASKDHLDSSCFKKMDKFDYSKFEKKQ